jgi:hypothetical protein
MKAQWTRYLIVALFACLLGALAHASISRAVQGRGSDSAPDTWRTAGRQTDAPPENALLRQLWELINRAKDRIERDQDLSSDDRSEALDSLKEAYDILEEADPILSRIKKENEQAIEILKNPPRQIIRPAPVRDKQKPAPDASDEDSPGP